MSDSSPSVPPPTWEGLLALARTLRGPQGCPWDRDQDLPALAGHLVEEAYEVLHSARAGTREDLAEELGDCLFVLALVQCAGEEAGAAAMDAILARVVGKIARRHPHVFEGTAGDARAVALAWEERKLAERGGPGEQAPPGTLGPQSEALPALLQARRMQERAALVGFDWPDAPPVLDKIEEELNELREAMQDASGGRSLERDARVREELGDLLFAVVNLARLLDTDAEESLRQATAKFRNRFNKMAERAAEQGTPLGNLDLDGMESLWRSVKGEERSQAS